MTKKFIAMIAAIVVIAGAKVAGIHRIITGGSTEEKLQNQEKTQAVTPMATAEETTTEMATETNTIETTTTEMTTVETETTTTTTTETTVITTTAESITTTETTFITTTTETIEMPTTTEVFTDVAIIELEPEYGSDAYLLAYAMSKESAVGDYTDAFYVGNVIMNRVDDSDFPDTVLGVIQQKGQYPWGSKEIFPREDIYDTEFFSIARRLVDGERQLPADVVWQAQFIQGEIYTTVGVHYYCHK